MADLVSVVIPTFNRAMVTKRALESVIEQDYRPLEIIIVDDGSNDNTREVLQGYLCESANLVVRYIYQENAGVSVARNRGIDNAHGVYCSTLDSDDILLPNKIRTQIEAMKHRNADVCYGPVLFREPRCLTRYHYPSPPSDDPVLQFLLCRNITPGNSWMYKRELVIKNGIRYREGCSWGEDNEFLVHLLFYANTVIYVDCVTSEITIGRSDGLSKFDWKQIDNDIWIYDKIKKWLLKQPISPQKREKYEGAINKFFLPISIISRVWVNRHAREARIQFQQHSDYLGICRLATYCNGTASIKLFIKYVLLKLYFKITTVEKGEL